MFLKYYIKAHLFREDHNNLTKSTNFWKDFGILSNYCDLLRIYELYNVLFTLVENYKTIPYGYVIDTCSKSHGNTISTFLIWLWDYLWILFFGKIPKWHNFRMRFLITDHSVVTLNGTPWGNCNIWWSTFGHASMKNTTMRSSNSQSIWRKVSEIAWPHFCCTLSHILQDHPFKTFTENWDSKRHLLELSSPI